MMMKKKRGQLDTETVVEDKCTTSTGQASRAAVSQDLYRVIYGGLLLEPTDRAPLSKHG